MKLLTSSLLTVVLASTAPAASVVNWVTTNGDAAYTGASAATNSPITTDADGDAIVGSFPTVTLAVGQVLVLNGSLNITGNTGNLPGNQFRWGLFDAPGTPTIGVGNGYVGVWAAAPTGAATANTVIANGSTTNPFSGSASTVVGSANDVGGNSAQYGTDLDFTLSITRVDATQISVSAQFTDNADVLVDWTSTNAPASPGSFTYDSVGILLGGTTNATQAAFSNVTAMTVPEPTSALMALVASLALIRRRR
ncbi:MAG: hypothetical protein ACJAQT_002304 [Akkermansiaceae bacterium]|jgi:hypothetical protein